MRIIEFCPLIIFVLKHAYKQQRVNTSGARGTGVKEAFFTTSTARGKAVKGLIVGNILVIKISGFADIFIFFTPAAMVSASEDRHAM